MKKLMKKLEQRYDGITDFHQRTKLPMSMETVRRFFTLNLKVTVQHFLIISMHLGFSPNEIRDMLINERRKYIVDTKYEQIHAAEIAQLIGESTVVLSKHEEALLSCWHKLHEKNRNIGELVAVQIDLFGKAYGIDLNDELQKLGGSRFK